VRAKDPNPLLLAQAILQKKVKLQAYPTTRWYCQLEHTEVSNVVA
jgi:hypothetical protein